MGLFILGFCAGIAVFMALSEVQYHRVRRRRLREHDLVWRDEMARQEQEQEKQDYAGVGDERGSEQAAG